ncbi:hypothetical protein C4559_05250 [Candidatus Microgenomates bacterium]|nr:MAG: hypothetical protein C4559_05250 [Candidatus Microgenomates bacterium]
MDPKKQLDPKLKETYDRVMSTTVPLPQKSTPPHKIPESEMVAIHNPSLSRKETPPIPVKPKTFVAKDNKESAKAKSGTSPVIIFLLLVVFLVGYTFFWLKYFNVSIPFLP